jgi:hypothetical protein
MNTNQNQNIAPATENSVAPATETVKPVVASVAKKSPGRPPLVCQNLDRYMAKQYTRLSLADIECAANLMGRWVEVKKGNVPVESARYVVPPKPVKVAKTKTTEVATPAS